MVGVGGGWGVRGFTLAYENVGDRDIFLVLLTEKLNNIIVRVHVNGDALPIAEIRHCNPHEDCGYDDFLPRLGPGQSLVRHYRMDDLIFGGVRAGVAYDLKIEPTAFAYFEGESRFEAGRKYAEVGRTTRASFQFHKVRLLPGASVDAE